MITLQSFYITISRHRPTQKLVSCMRYVVVVVVVVEYDHTTVAVRPPSTHPPHHVVGLLVSCMRFVAVVVYA